MKKISALAAILAIPAMAAPAGYFQVPGTETTMQVYGRAQMNAIYGIEGYDTAQIFDSPNIFGGAHQSTVQKNQFDMDVSGSRIGIQTMTPSSFGDVKVKVEGDFFGVSPTDGRTNKAFRMRHAFGKIGGLTIGQTDSIFADGDSSPAYLDQDGLYSDFYGNGRVPQISWSMDFTKEVNFAIGIERDKTSSNDHKFPGALVAALGFSSDWGHVRGAVAFAKKSIHTNAAAATTTAKLNNNGTITVTPVAAVAESDVDGNAFSWNVGANVNLGKGSLTATVRRGAGFYGTSTIDGFFANGSSLDAYYDMAWQLGYSMPLSDSFTIATGWGEVTWKDETIGATTFNKTKIDQLFVNGTWQATKQFSFGAEYFYSSIKTPDVLSFTKDDGTATDKANASRLNFQVRYTFF